MPRLPTFLRTLRSICAALCVIVTAIAPHAAASEGDVLRAEVRPLPGLTDARTALVGQLSRDGTLALVWVDALEEMPAHIRVVDTRSGSIVFDSRPEQSATRTFGDALLTADGRTLIYGELSPDGTARIVRARDLASSAIRVLLTGPPSLRLHAVSDDQQVVAFTDDDVVAPVVVARAGSGFQRFGPVCDDDPTLRAQGPVSLSNDGRFLTYHNVWHFTMLHPSRPVVADAVTGAAVCLKETPASFAWWPQASVSGNGHWILAHSSVPSYDSLNTLFERATGRPVPFAPAFQRSTALAISDDSRYVLFTAGTSQATGDGLYLLDLANGVQTEIEPPPSGINRLIIPGTQDLSGDGSTATFEREEPVSEGVTRRVPYIASLDVDSDADGLHDAWEVTFGLNPSDPADASLDPDGDGLTNAQEFTAGTHPQGTPVRYFAEGADGGFFATSLALFNPSDAEVLANVRFLGPDGVSAARPVLVAAGGPAYLEPGLTFTEFSIVVESPVPLVAERRMTWDRMGRYGSHSSAGVAAPATTWHFAEGATIAGVQTFFLLQNPTTQPATVTLHYLLATGTMEVRTHVVPAQSRLTVWANQEGVSLDAAEFATTITADQPIVAERAMYRDAPGEMFAGGSVAAGMVAPATSWFFAEGATGDYFDTYVLIANPGDQSATVQATYVRAFDPADTSTATPIERTYTIPPRTRLTLWVAREDQALSSTQVSTRLTSDVPIVAERAMWWPGPTAATWRESHAEVGATQAGLRWAVADLPIASAPDAEDAFLLLATTQQTLATARVALACADGTRISRDVSLSVHRTTLWIRHVFPEVVGQRCAATVESLPTRITLSPEVPLMRVPLVVESAVYGSGFAAGAVTLTTRLPDPD